MSLLPKGFGIELAAGVRRYGGGRVLAGASPLRVMRLTAAGARAVEQVEGGRPASAAARALAARLVNTGLANPVPGEGVPAPSVTVVIPARDRLADVEACLASLGPEPNVVVVDDGSRQPWAITELCRRHQARYLRRERSGGPAAARNAGLAVVQTELVAFLDSDCTVGAGWLEALARRFADPRVGAVAPRIRPSTAGPSATRPSATRASATRRASARERYAAARSPLDLGPRAGAVGPGRPITYVPAAALVVRVRSLEADGFAESLRYGEDIDLVWRLQERGWTVRYDPSVVVGHCEPASWRGLLTRRYRYGTSAAPLARRHPGRLAPAVLAPRPTLAAALLLAGWPAPAPALGSALGVALSAPLRHVYLLSEAGLPPQAIAGLGPRAVWHTLLGLSRAGTTLAAPALLGALAVCQTRRTRRAVITLLAAAPAAQWLAARPALDPVRWTAAAIADDAAYGAGVWRGCLRERTTGPLRPRFARAVARI